MIVLSRLRRKRAQRPPPKRQQPVYGPRGKKIWFVLLNDNWNSELRVEADRLARAPDGTLLALDNDPRLGYPTGARFVCRAGRWNGYTDRKTQLMAKAKVTVTRSGNKKAASGLTVQKADPSKSKPFKWAWEQRILVEYINILLGEEKIGKGNLAAWILARVTRGELPGNLFGKPGKVAIIGDEDSFYHVWVPRLKVAGANLDLVEHIVGKDGAVLDVHNDAKELRQHIKEEGLVMVYIDQLLDNLGVANNWHDKQVRNALAPLGAVVRETRVAVLATMHPNKSKGGSFRDRIAGSPAFNAVARSSLLVARHPNEPGRVAVVLGPNNYASQEAEAFEFCIEGQEYELLKPKRTITASRITDTRMTSLTRAEVEDGMDKSGRREDSNIGKARQLLLEMFAPGEEREAGVVQTELLNHHGIYPRVSTKARKELGFDSYKEKRFGGHVYWRRKGESRKGAV
jgi:AAA domain